MVAQGAVAGSSAIVGWSRALGGLHRRIGHRFARSEARERVKRYLVGLLGRVERKNSWQLAEAIGERDPQGVQRLLNSAQWDADEVRDDLRDYGLEHLGEEATGVLIVDETGFLKKGDKERRGGSPVHRHRGRNGQLPGRSVPGLRLGEGCRLSRPGALPAQILDERPSQEGGGRRSRGDRIPQQGRTGPEDAPAGLRRRGPCQVGRGGFVLRALARLQGVAGGARPAVRHDGAEDERRALGRPQEEDRVARRAVARGAFSEVSSARDTGVGRPWEWVCLELAPVPEKTMRRWLLIRRSIEDPEDLGFYQAYGPEGTSVKELVGACQERWAVEECFAEAKGEVGLDHYEVRRWDAWHRHVTLSLLAHAFLAVTRRAAAKEEGSPKKGIPTPISSRLQCRRRGSSYSPCPRRRAEDASC